MQEKQAKDETFLLYYKVLNAFYYFLFELADLNSAFRFFKN